MLGPRGVTTLAAHTTIVMDAFPPLLVKRLSEFATLPVRGSEHAAGYDISAAHDTTVPARGQVLVKTDLAMAIPDGTYGRVAPRSGLAHKHGIDVGAGVIDADYRGPLGVILFNFKDTDFEIKRGDRVAQLVLERIATPAVEEVTDLPDTVRGAGGFGSTGVDTKLEASKRARVASDSKEGDEGKAGDSAMA